MMRSLYAGISGLRNHQTRMDVIGNNIANVNTVGFKGSRVTFQDMLSQTIQGASGAAGNRGGTNPMQIGLGMGLASVDTIFTDGSFQPTGKQTDLAIGGQGFFILSDGENQIYSRAGAFDFDTAGNFLVPGTGYKVMGYKAGPDGVIDPNQPIQAINIPVGGSMPAQVTTALTYANNLSASAAADATSQVQTTINVYDTQGNAYKLNGTFQKVGTNSWSFTPAATITDATGAVVANINVVPPALTATSTINFNANGSYNAATSTINSI
ncbi:MAG: flagellar hook-basal body complex protein, partial [Sporomusaceae bacterium]|nr:flagellar hook-basal body complex protein [Sporomusaceae bacterium]